MSDETSVPAHDEAFFTDEQVERAFPGLPPGFDQILLRRLGLPCGADDAREHYALLKERGGWRVWRVSELVAQTHRLWRESRKGEMTMPG